VRRALIATGITIAGLAAIAGYRVFATLAWCRGGCATHAISQPFVDAFA
jgi:hypothetical protein